MVAVTFVVLVAVTFTIVEGVMVVEMIPGVSIHVQTDPSIATPFEISELYMDAA